MKDRIVRAIERFTLVSRIRIAYVIPLIPLLILSLITGYNLWTSNREYGAMIDSVVKASTFNLDFKQEFDDETYMLIVGQKHESTSGIPSMIRDARQVVKDLGGLTATGENADRLAQIEGYLTNLESYISRIHENMGMEGAYDENMQIWENDVQVGTSLLQEAFYEYIYYEVKDLEKARTHQQSMIARIFTGTVIAYFIVVILLILGSYYFNRLLRQVRHEQKQLRKTEFLVLQSQINPHFLYNTLDAITWLAESGEHETVVKMVGSLSGFFRASLGQGKDIVTVAEDVGHSRSYLEIQKIRYQDILEYTIDVPEMYNDALIPKITIQPLVENALYHGIKNRRGGGRIEVSGYRQDTALIIEVRDNGVGMNEERLAQVRAAISESSPHDKGVYGVYNVNERIRLHFGDEYGLTIDSVEGEGTVSKIRLPLAPLS